MKHVSRIYLIKHSLLLAYFIRCYDIKPVRTKEGISYWKIPLGVDDATREK